MTHFTRLIDLTSADEAYVSTLAQTLAPCILRPRVESSLTVNERHSYRLIRDLFDHKDTIFGELKRQSSFSTLGAGSAQARPRAISTDESNRRAAMEARNRAIASRSRATSPAPSARHRRDRSADGSAGSTRFPINVSSPTAADRRHARQSLEVPGNGASSPDTDQTTTANSQEDTNSTAAEATRPLIPAINTSTGAGAPASGSDGSPTPTGTPVSAAATGEVEKRNSLTRGVGRYNRKPGMNLSRSGMNTSIDSTTKRDSLPPEGELKGVTLEDKPMDD
jgi:hypothetical protein